MSTSTLLTVSIFFRLQICFPSEMQHRDDAHLQNLFSYGELNVVRQSVAEVRSLANHLEELEGFSYFCIAEASMQSRRLLRKRLETNFTH